MNHKVRIFINQALGSEYPDIVVAGQLLQDMAEQNKKMMQHIVRAEYEHFWQCKHCGAVSSESPFDVIHKHSCPAYIFER